MALTLPDLVKKLNEIKLTEKRPRRKINSLVREIGNEPITGNLTIESVTTTVAYTRIKTLRDGKTIKCALPQSDYTLEVQIHAEEDVREGESSVFTFALDKFDGFSLVFYAHQVQAGTAESVIAKNSKQSVTGHPESDSPTGQADAAHRLQSNFASEAEDSLAAFRTEALTILSKDIPHESSDTSNDVARLQQLLDDSRQQLANSTRRANSHTKINASELESKHPKSDSVRVSSETNTIGTSPTDSSEFSQAIEDPTSPPEKPISGSTNPTEDVHDHNAEERANPIAHSPLSPKKQNPSSKEKIAAPPARTLPDLLDDALGESEAPVTLELLSTIVSLQTGIPVSTVAEAQKHMWSQLSSPKTFGEGKSRYRFPLLGEFQVRNNDGDISLDFSSNDIETIAAAKVNETVEYKQATKYVESNSGPLIARHALTLGLSTAAAMGIAKTHSYLVVYRTVLLLLRIIGKGTRRIRIEEVGEFFPSIISGSKAYRFRVYPTLLRATSSAFKDATAFLSKTGEAQKRFDTQTQIDNKASDSSHAGVGCVLLAGLIFAIAFWFALT